MTPLGLCSYNIFRQDDAQDQPLLTFELTRFAAGKIGCSD